MIDRDILRKEALSWLGTPWRHAASVKGKGVDCAQLVFCVFKNIGIIPKDIKLQEYSPQYYLHRSKDMYLVCIQAIADELPESQRHEADIVLYRFGRVFNHAAIVIDWPKVIHAVNEAGTVLDDAEKCTLMDAKPLEIKYFKLRDQINIKNINELPYILKS